MSCYLAIARQKFSTNLAVRGHAKCSVEIVGCFRMKRDEEF